MTNEFFLYVTHLLVRGSMQLEKAFRLITTIFITLPPDNTLHNANV